MDLSSLDPSSLLKKLDSVTKVKEGDSGSNNSSWFTPLITFIVSIVGVLIWYWVSNRHNKELAKLRHEKNKAKFLKEKAELEVKLDKNNEEIAAYTTKVEIADKHILDIDSEIEEKELKYEDSKRAIDSIRSWRDAGLR